MSADKMARCACVTPIACRDIRTHPQVGDVVQVLPLDGEPLPALLTVIAVSDQGITWKRGELYRRTGWSAWRGDSGYGLRGVNMRLAGFDAFAATGDLFDEPEQLNSGVSA